MQTHILLIMFLLFTLAYVLINMKNTAVDAANEDNEEADEEFMDDLEKAAEFMNDRLWACGLLATCRVEILLVKAMDSSENEEAYVGLYGSYLTHCYDKMDEDSAEKYVGYSSHSEVDCTSKNILQSFDLDEKKYKKPNKEDEEAIMKHQVTLALACALMTRKVNEGDYDDIVDSEHSKYDQSL